MCQRQKISSQLYFAKVIILEPGLRNGSDLKIVKTVISDGTKTGTERELVFYQCNENWNRTTIFYYN